MAGGGFFYFQYLALNIKLSFYMKIDQEKDNAQKK
jgi:hypothetical protein